MYKMILSELLLKQQKHVTGVCYILSQKQGFYSTNLTEKCRSTVLVRNLTLLLLE